MTSFIQHHDSKIHSYGCMRLLLAYSVTEYSIWVLRNQYMVYVPTLYVEALISSFMVIEGGAFGKKLELDEVMRVEPLGWD